MNIEIIKNIFTSGEFLLPLITGLAACIFFAKIAPHKRSVLIIAFVGAAIWGFVLHYWRAKSGIELSWVFTPRISNTFDLPENKEVVYWFNNSTGITFSAIAVIISAIMGSLNPSNIFTRTLYFFIAFIPGQFAFIVMDNVLDQYSTVSRVAFFVAFWMIFFALILLPSDGVKDESD